MQGMIGQKKGMTQVFDAQGHRVSVTMIQAGPCVVVQAKPRGKRTAVQLGFLEQKESRMIKPALSRFKKINVTPRRHLKEFLQEEGEELKPGDTVTVKMFEGVSHVDVSATTKGQGFQGVVKRYKMAGGPAAHGHTSHRRIGAIGQRAKTSRVARGHRMPGHMGNVNVTIQNLRVVEVREPQNLLLVHGAVPGPTGSVVYVRKALKKQSKPK